MADVGVDRNLLFGLIALQNGLIDQAQLVAAFHAWSRDKGRPIADLLAERGDLGAAQRQAVDAMVALHIEEHGGDVERSLADLGAGPSTVEGLTVVGDSDLGDALATLAVAAAGSEAFGQTLTMTRGTATAAGQRYRVLRPHARGGLGVVSVALDGELNREVALKEIQDRYADDPVSRARFLLEAEITGGLEHPGIVPVYGLGRSPDGRPYYAMRLIRGESLKDAVDRFHADPDLKRDPGNRTLAGRKLLRRFLDVCYAVEYAHQRGVLHRDLKPANVMVGKYGETLVVDWGLAKSVDRPDPAPGEERPLIPTVSGGSSATLPGSTIGTPAFMSPEQASGEVDRLGPASDVYSLGATLYCMMTGKPPFAGDHVETVLAAVKKGDFPRPSVLNPVIDPATEAVCLKAMALRPGDRYGSARELAEDLERWAADEPVRAWREPFIRRARRWARRHRSAVTATSAAVLVALVGLALVLFLLSRENSELAHDNDELTAARKKAEDRFAVAMAAIRTFHTGAMKELLLRDEKFGEARRGLLLRRDFYAQMQAMLRGDTDPRAMEALGQAGFDLGSLMDLVGSRDDALAAHRNALDIRARLALGPAATPEARADEARSLLAVADILAENGDTGEGLTAALKARGILTLLARDGTPFDRFREDLASAHATVGDLLSQTGKAEEALAEYREARDIQRALVKARPDDTQTRGDLGLNLYHVGRLLWQTGRRDEALASIEEARAVQKALVEEDPSEVRFRGDQARSRFFTGFLMLQGGNNEEAERLCRDALAAQEALVNEYPALIRFEADLARSRFLMGRVLAQTGKPDEAMGFYEKARVLEEARVAANSAVIRFQGDLARTYYEIGGLLARTGKAGEAWRPLKRSREIRKAVAKAHPDLVQFQADLARSDWEIGNLYSRTGKPEEAAEWYERARDRQAELVRANPTLARYRGDLAKTLARVGGLRLRAGRHGDAAAALTEAVSILGGVKEPAPDLRVELACCHFLLSDLASRPGSGVSASQGEAHAREAVRGLRGLAGHFRHGDPRANTDLEPIRDRPGFGLLMKDVTFPADPFAR